MNLNNKKIPKILKLDIQEKPFNTGQFCECGGEIWSNNYGYKCKRCHKEKIISPSIELKIEEEAQK